MFERKVPMASERRIYRAIDPISRLEAESAVKRNDADELSRVVIAVGLHSDDAAWAEAFCLRLAKHKSGNVRGNALLAMGYLAMRFGRIRDECVAAVSAGLNDPDDWVRGQADSAADDLEWYARRSARDAGSSVDSEVEES